MLWEGTTLSFITSWAKMSSACKRGNLIQVLQQVNRYCVFSFRDYPQYTHTNAGTVTSTNIMTTSLQVLIYAPFIIIIYHEISRDTRTSEDGKL